MKTVSEYRDDSGDYTAEVLWYAKTKKWVVRCYFEHKEVDEQIFPTEYEAEDCAEDFVRQAEKPVDLREDEDPQDTGEA